jgi:3-hydroxyisobutyrate dehydrogenase-like beta-hydroxyacid dehydrogenase
MIKTFVQHHESDCNAITCYSGLEALKKGQMTVFMAGDKDLAEEMRPLMEDIYCNVLYTGRMGTALIPKVVFSILLFTLF